MHDDKGCSSTDLMVEFAAPRLALELLLQTKHARADVDRMGRQHIKAANSRCAGKRPMCNSPLERAATTLSHARLLITGRTTLPK
jgi:hypothetical protein